MALEIDPRREFLRAELGDRRLNARVERLVEAFEDAPDRSFPSAMQSDSELEAAYRFFSNPRVSMEKLLAPHIAATVVRAGDVTNVLVLHDTTEFRFGGMKERRGLGKIANNGQGFFGHVALAVSGDGDRTVLGLAGLLTVTRAASRPVNLETVDYLDRRAEPRESDRWNSLVRQVSERMAHLDPIHVMDREGDDFDLFTDMVDAGERFVVRMSIQRRRRGRSVDFSIKSPFIRDVLYAAGVVVSREVRLSARGNKRGGSSERIHPPRETRTATFDIAAARITLDPPRRLKKRYRALPLNAVLVREIDQPSGVEPIEWMLLTTEPVNTPEEVLVVVDAYRARWTIEEYFKVLKSGCAIERRQLESSDALHAALGFFAPIAARVLALRNRARCSASEPARSVLSALELKALRVIARSKLPRSPTVKEALYAIAGVGGHLKRNGEPGWQVLCRGFEKLEIALQVVEAFTVGKRPM